MIRAVIFDFDGTLAYTKDIQVARYQDLLSSFGYPVPPPDRVMDTFGMPEPERIRLLTGGESPERVKEILSSKQASEFPLEKMKFPNGLLDVLEQLKSEGYVMAISTSAPPGFVASVLSAYNLYSYFAAVVDSGVCKVPKPDPESLLVTARMIGANPKECIHVGDQEKDIKAAKAAGMRSVLIAERSEGTADAHIRSFSELPRVISTLEQASARPKLKL